MSAFIGTPQISGIEGHWSQKMKFRSLQIKINTAIIIVAIAITVLFAGFLFPYEKRQRSDQIKRINLLLDTVFSQKRNDLANELFARQERALRATLEELKMVEGILGVSIHLPDGRLYMTTDSIFSKTIPEDRIKALESSSLLQIVSINHKSMGIYENIIEVIGDKIGFIAIYYDFAKLEREIRQSLVIFLSLLVATIVFMSILLNLFLSRSVIKPVSLLRNAMRKVEEGRLGETVRLQSRDEIGQMGSAFNDMSFKLKEGREALITAEEKYRSIFENALEGIFQSTPDHGKYVTVNSCMALMLGYQTPGQLMASVSDIGKQLFAHLEDASKFDLLLKNDGQVIGFETELYRKDNSTIWVSISARSVLDDHGALLYYEGSLLDITERRQREKAEREREAAEAANQAKSKFLANMSHEIRTPLNAILGFADILDSALKEKDLQDYVRTIKLSGSNLLQLINDILDLSKIEAGRMEIQRTPVNIRSLFEAIRSFFSISVEQKNIDLMVEVSSEIQTKLMLDQVRLRQVLFNLIGNAVKFTDHGYVKLSARIQPGMSGQHQDLIIAIEDTGLGIDSQSHKEVFKSFRQDSDHNHGIGHVEGTGLGLTISKKLIEMMGGKINLESQKGEGSTFQILLPDVAMGNLLKETQEVRRPPGRAVQNILFEPATVLVADDLEVNRRLILNALKTSPLKVIEAENGRSAVSMAAQHMPNIILMDIKMPKLNGYQAIEEMRSSSPLDQVPIIAITAAGMKEDIDRIKAAGFDDYLIRPFNRFDLQKKLSRFLAHKVELGRFSDNEGGKLIPLNLENLKLPREVCLILHNQLRRQWEEVQRKQSIPDIIAFATEIIAIGDKYDLVVVSEYGQSILEYTNSFDVDMIKTSLDQYPKLVDCARLD